MKINVEFDLTPAEFRQALGLPDVDAFQREMLARIQEQMEAGVDGYDPWSLMQPFFQQGVTQGMSHFGNYQQMMLDLLRRAGSARPASEASSGGESDGSSGEPREKEGSARATSRQSRRPKE
ncbi:hypothetical protein KGQ90_01190 [Modicisalibacter tunisiensis]|uniref:hypothetical protein n=1 Tax=Modicisalibacter tunisiensis TaxID=390637 RepID=UPI001CCC2B7A|nr:hypothetical protein [Modicisalibacter tunisiensis]MBZ9537559.1 hypothetical protein [Modicisalibacter tunisiensis]